MNIREWFAKDRPRDQWGMTWVEAIPAAVCMMLAILGIPIIGAAICCWGKSTLHGGDLVVMRIGFTSLGALAIANYVAIFRCGR